MITTVELYLGRFCNGVVLFVAIVEILRLHVEGLKKIIISEFMVPSTYQKII